MSVESSPETSGAISLLMMNAIESADPYAGQTSPTPHSPDSVSTNT